MEPSRKRLLNNFTDGNRRVANSTNAWDLPVYSEVKAFSLLVNPPNNRKREQWYSGFIPNMMRLYEDYGMIEGQMIVRYIILVYDKKSPFRVSSPLLKKRKPTVARELEMTDELATKCVMLSENGISFAIVDYLKYQEDSTWRLILQCEESFNKNEEEILSSFELDIKDKDRFQAAKYRADLLKMQQEIKKDLDGLYSKFTGNDPDAAIAVNQFIYTPETVADILEDVP